ncbi:hypothetical protein NX059_007944 [Plenodomus lindquistii]|nr:hypothetical protein NX059_007944 [Plenodomus lindquistii]
MSEPKAASDPQPVKSFASGTLQKGEYGALGGFGEKQSDKPLFGPVSAVPPERRKKVIIVGGGINGIQQASTLLRDGCVSLKDIQIFDALDGFGGVWQKNKYPGCACDVPSSIYTSSIYLNRYWTHRFANRAQIQSYFERFALDYHLDQCTQFRTFVQACTWDEELLVWHVAVAKQGKVEHWIADIVCQCVGSLDRPKFGTTPGRELFKGASWHTAYWNNDYDLSGKRVAIIGCGPSAAQIIPEIVDKVEHLTIYMRTPPVCVPRGDYAYSRFFRWALKWVPFVAWFSRARLNLWMITFGRGQATDGHPRNDMLNQRALAHMESQVKDPELRKILTPNSKFFCKRPLYLDHFYPALVKPNCTVLRENLISYTENGVLSSDSNGTQTERKFDVIIFGTGFNAAQYLEHETIRGLNGCELQTKWKAHPEALYGLATNQFPNMFFCFGPNSATVWGSQLDNWEQQARFATKAVSESVKRARKGTRFAMHPKRSVELDYNAEVQKRQAGVYTWSTSSCITYYKNDDGWNTFTMPWSWWQFRRMLRKIFWDQWEVIEKPLEKF